MKKLTILGDIMNEPPVHDQVKCAKGFDYTYTFKYLKELLKASDYSVANLETPLAGEAAVYTHELVSFNAPDEIARAVKDTGIGLVTTANNHCFDRGLGGAYRTIDVLDSLGLKHTGTFKQGKRKEAEYFTVGDATVAVISYTYGTNSEINHCIPDSEHNECVNLLRDSVDKYLSQRVGPNPDAGKLKALKEAFAAAAGYEASWEDVVALKRALRMWVGNTDDVYVREELDRALSRIEADYKKARENADIVIFYPHTGGQFNVKVGEFSRYFVKKAAEMGFDAIIAAHSHTTQEAEYLGGVPCFYSLGNVTMSPNSMYADKACLPQYGLAAHFYIENKKIAKTTFTIFKIIEDGTNPITAEPVHMLYPALDSVGKEHLEADVKAIYARVAKREICGDIIRSEYEL